MEKILGKASVFSNHLGLTFYMVSGTSQVHISKLNFCKAWNLFKLPMLLLPELEAAMLYFLSLTISGFSEPECMFQIVTHYWVIWEKCRRTLGSLILHSMGIMV